MTKMIKGHFWYVKTKKVTKDELGGKIMIEYVGLRAKTYAYLMDDDSKHKKARKKRSV